MREPDQTAAWWLRALGAPAVVVAVQVFVAGLYLPPVFVDVEHWSPPEQPPHTIISVPVHTAEW